VPSPYTAVLSVPGARGFVAAAFVGRLPIAMYGLGQVLLVQPRTGSYGLGGAVAATGALSSAATAPRIGRLLDRHGQARVLLGCLAVHLVGLLGLVAAVSTGGARWSWFAAAAVGGAAAPPLGVAVRARWSSLLGGSPRLQTAFAVESILEELIFIVGPVLVTTLAVTVSPEAGLSTAAGLVLAGTLAFTAQRATDPGALPRSDRHVGGLLGRSGLRVLVGSFLAAGVLFSALEVAVVAFVQERDAPGAAGPVLAVFAAASMTSGLVYGARRHRAPLHRRFLLGIGALAVGMLAPLAAAGTGSVPLLAAGAALAGVAIAPTLIAGFSLVERLVPPAARSEGLAWVSTAVGVGLAVGAPLAGRLIDASGSLAGFGVVAGAAAVAAGVAAAGRRALRPTPAGDGEPAPSVAA
jgi:MFS family permease